MKSIFFYKLHINSIDILHDGYLQTMELSVITSWIIRVFEWKPVCNFAYVSKANIAICDKKMQILQTKYSFASVLLQPKYSFASVFLK